MGMTALTTHESHRLENLEESIRDDLQTRFKSFVRIGAALAEIRDAKLYRDGYGTFENYCQERWDMTRQYAHNLIGSSRTVKVLKQNDPKTSTIGYKTPETESQARPLAKLPAAKQAEVWQEAVDTAPEGRVTAKHVEAVVERHREPREPSADEVAKDCPAWRWSNHWHKIYTYLKATRTDGDIKRLVKHWRPEEKKYYCDELKRVKGELDSMIKLIGGKK